MLPRIAALATVVALGLILVSRGRRETLRLDPNHTLAAARGGRMTLLARDSPTAVLVVTAECAKCRIGVAAYRDLAEVVQSEGIAFRSVIASGPVTGRQFATLLPDAPHAALDPDSAVLRTLRVSSVPALVLVDAERRRTRVLALAVPVPDTLRLRRQIRRFR